MKIFIVYSVNIIPNFLEAIKKSHKENFTFLCLDALSANILNELGFSSSFLEDWVSSEERIKIHSVARRYEELMCKEFFEVNQKINFNISSDRVILNCFWYEFALQEFLYKKFIELDIDEVRFFKFNEFGPAIHETFSDTFGNYWLNQKSSKPLITPIHVYRKNYKIRKFLLKIDNYLDFIKSYISLWIAPKKKKLILFSCTFQEFYYYRKLILTLKKSIGEEIVVLINNINFVEAFKLQLKYKIKIFSFIPYIGKNKFSNKIKLKKNSRIHGAFFALKSDIKNFEYFQSIRWPSLIIHRIKLAKLLSQISPSLIIYTALEDYFNQMVGEIASNMNIDSISLPHGILATTRRGITFANEYAVGNELAKFCAQASGISSKRIKTLKDLDPEHEYPMDFKLKLNGKFNVVALIDPVKSSSDTRVYSSPPVGYRDQVQAINDLSKLSVNNEINLIIKTHPGWPEHEIINLSNKGLLKFLCPKNTSLEDLLDQANLVIGINYYGAALVSAAKRNLPIVLHYVAPIKNFTNLDNTYSRFFELGEITSNSSELFNTCNKAITNENYRKDMINKTINFKEKFLDSSNLQSIDKYILGKLNR